MRARLEALCKEWEQWAAKAEADVEGSEGAGAWGAAGNIVGTRQCAADLRALLSEPERVRMEPQPLEIVTIEKVDGYLRLWYWRGHTMDGSVFAPTPAHRPVCDKDGKWGTKGDWWWEVSNDSLAGVSAGSTPAPSPVTSLGSSPRSETNPAPDAGSEGGVVE